MRRLGGRRGLIAIGFGVALVVLVADAARSFLNTSGLIAEAGWVGHTHGLLDGTRTLLAALTEAEMAVRTYIRSGGENSLTAYKNAVANVEGQMRELREMADYTPSERPRLNLLLPLVEERLATLAESVERRRTQGVEAALRVSQSDRAETAENTIRNLASSIENEVERQVTVRSLRATERATHNRLSVFVGDVLSIVLLVLVFHLLNREIGFRERVEAEVRNLNVELQQRVVDLRNANQEMEAFSFSVSHDLRSPLAVIGGFSHILTEEYADKVDDEGKRCMRIIQNNTHKMGQLIDDLLGFSRLGRQAIHPVDIDMEELVRDVFAEVRMTSGRGVHLDIQSVGPARGDAAMIRQVWANLLSNAVKFSAHNDQARVEVVGAAKDGENLYSVHDNGAGFDMEYAGRLFGVFQRLHSGEEFEGTGVGLAIVKRIVERHGGRVWGEGKVGEGATFYFTLPPAATVPEPAATGKAPSGQQAKEQQRWAGMAARSSSSRTIPSTSS